MEGTQLLNRVFTYYEVIEKAKLREISYVDNELTNRDNWVFNEESECHTVTFH